MSGMNSSTDWKVPKLPFLVADAVLILAAAGVIWKARHPISQIEIGAAIGCVVLGSLLGCLPYILDYRATGKLVEANALGEVTGKIEDLKKFTAQVSTVTDQWARVQEATQGHAEKTAAAAREISDRIAAEVRDFSEFQKKMNDAERGALRLEVEKLRRIEGDWLQVLVRILDHIFALHTASVRSGQPELAAQIGNFQNACRDVVRRVGLVSLVVDAGEPFHAERHRAHGIENPPADAPVAETLAPGFSFQGRLIRPALVRLQEKETAPADAALEIEEVKEATETAEEKPSDELPLEAE
jgi:molecular chaperone GrpE (heat shock protein)